MSQIFKALQRAEIERQGAEPPSPLLATEILERAERFAVTEWESTKGGADHNGSGQDPQDRTASLRAAVSELPEPITVANQRILADEDRARAFNAFKTISPLISEDSRLVCVTQQDTPTAEAFRLLGVRLRDMRQDRELKKILVTSALPQEGKSTVAANLACALAQTGKERVLLLEGDVRRPTQAKLFGLEAVPGMSDWLHGQKNISECIYHIKTAGLWILPAGAASRNSLELLQLERVASLMSRLELWFDTIVIDSPPVLPLADTSVWTRLADGILLVTREGTTERRQLLKGLEAIEKEKMIGAILNCSKREAHRYYYY